MMKLYRFAKSLMICGLFVFAAQAQRGDSVPTVSLTCPTEAVESGSPVTLVAAVSGNTGGSATYNWSVSSGMISSGQGTPVITIETNDLYSTTVTATLNLGGDFLFPVNTSCSFVIKDKPVQRLVNELTFSAQGELKAVMDAYMTELSSDPAAQGYIVLYPPTPQAQARVARFIRTFINDRKFDSPRIRIVVGKKRGDRAVLRFWIVPPGAEFTPD